MVETLGLFPLMGQEAIWRRWQKLLDSRRLGHAHILFGRSGVGKDSLALRIAATVNCNSTTRPCGECPSCRRMATLEHPAVHLIHALPRKKASKTDPFDGLKEKEMDQIRSELERKAAWPYHRLNITGANDIRIASIRKLRKEIYLHSNPGETKVILILRAHRMNLEAANALLKILEEPPAGSLFLLTTEYPDQLPDTIRSRCQQHRIPDLPWETIREYLRAETDANPRQTEVAARLSQGSLELARQFSGGETSEWLSLVDRIIQMLQEEDYASLAGITRELADKDHFDEASRAQILDLLILVFRDLAHLELEKTDSHWTSSLQHISDAFPNANPVRAVQHIERSIDALSRKVYLPLALTSLFLALRKELRGKSEPEFEETLYS